jgi:hypothetical protein
MKTFAENDFWQLIANARQQADEDPYQVCAALSALLLARSADDCLQFQHVFNRLHNDSYRADLWGAAYIMNGGCSDDGFDYFRGWLIAQGREVFEAALAKPDSLVKVVGDDAEADFGFEDEDILNLARRAWLEKTGLDDAAFDAAYGEYERYPVLGEFEWSGADGDIDERKAKKIYPKLWKAFNG